jgi:hypothetical protein
MTAAHEWKQLNHHMQEQKTAQKELQQQNSSKPNLRSSLIQDQADKPFNKIQ